MAVRQTHNLILSARTEAKLKALAQDVSKQVECKVILTDLSVSGSAQKLDEQTKDFDVAVLINNAGIAAGGSFEDMELEDIQRVSSQQGRTCSGILFIDVKPAPSCS